MSIEIIPMADGIRSGQPLYDPTHHQQQQRRGQGRDQGPERQRGQHDNQEPLLAMNVAHAAEDRSGDRGAQQVGGEGPRGGIFGDVQLVLDGGEGR
jgi:hypothetical protein